MEIVCESDYQDIYRITDGVLLVINKFRPMKIDGVKYPRMYWANRSNSRIYADGCQKDLKRLIKVYKHEAVGDEPEWTLPIGTVLYNGMPIEIADKSEWKYQIKTTGEMFSGTAKDVLDYMKTIKEIIDSKMKGYINE